VAGVVGRDAGSGAGPAEPRPDEERLMPESATGSSDGR
jgi:hypothetical protein